MTMSPQYPAPGDTVTFTLQDFQDDLNVASVAWTVNGTQKSSGVGQTSFQVTAGAVGSRATVTATVTTAKGATLIQSGTIIPAGVDLLWQAHSYVPPFYLGKALFPFQGTITVTAMPTFALTNPKNAVYKWQLDGGAMSDVSGSGKNTITLTGSILLKPINLSVTVQSADGSLMAQNSITLTGTTGLSKDEIDAKVREAEAHKSEDDDRKKLLEDKNHLDQTIYQLEKLLKENGDKQDIAGHSGGDNFVIITSHDRYSKICSELIKSFDLLIEQHYDKEDREKGYIVTNTRRGEEIRTPLMTLSVSIVWNVKRKLSHFAQVEDIATELKQYAQKFPKSEFVVDRRTN